MEIIRYQNNSFRNIPQSEAASKAEIILAGNGLKDKSEDEQCFVSERIASENSYCKDGVCVVTWKPVHHAA